MNDFHRYEKKFVLTKDLYQLLKNEIMPFVYPDTNSDTPRYTIHNIYYDTVDDELLKKSVSKPEFKEKLRLRSYGKMDNDSIVFLELKKKLHGFVHKSRTLIRLDAAKHLIEHGVYPLAEDYHNKQVLNEVYFFVSHHELEPSFYLSYDREAFHGIDNHTLRITFDHRITASNHKQESVPMKEDMIIMEVKTPHSIPLWLSNLLTTYQIYSQSFSKVGAAYYETLITSRKEHNTCLNPYLTSLPVASH